ncbi:hypothetical protein lbkm_2727 [Lachnospiraceae bacterium KM106-2]|nr:hypothetical protein lbkm_2727 [Lachnospiraceae bacterium KM106-2]
MHYLFSIMVTVGVGFRLLIKLLQDRQDVALTIAFYGGVILIGWLPSIAVLIQNRFRRVRIKSGKVQGACARCMSRVLVGKEEQHRYRYTFSTDLGEVKTLRFGEQIGKEIYPNDTFYVVRVSSRDTFFIRVD